MNRAQIVGYAGLILLQCNFLPAIYQAIVADVKMSVPSLIMYILAIACFLYNAVKEKNTLYIWCNALSLTGNSILLTLAVFK